MKRLVSMLMIIAFVIGSVQISFAADSVTMEPIRFDLVLAKDDESKKIMEEAGLSELKASIEEEYRETIHKNASKNSPESFSLNVKECSVKDREITVSGDGQIIICSKAIPFQFKNQKLSVESLENGSKVCAGVIKTEIEKGGETVPINIDLCSTYDFKKCIASVAFDLLEEQGQVLFYGDLFDEYLAYLEQGIKVKSDEAIFCEAENLETTSEKGNTKYAHVGTARNQTLGGASGKETLVMCVSKRDYRDRKSKDIGFEMIRVFGRSSNALSYVSSANKAYPIATDVTFKCLKKDFLDVTKVTPSGSGDNLPGIFDLVAKLHPNADGFITVVDILYKLTAPGTTSSIYAQSGFADANVAKATIAISGLNNMKNVNLPKSSEWGDAKADSDHGLAWKVKYETTGDDTAGSASVVVTSKLDYRFYYDNNRTTVKTTGAAKIQHTIYKP